MNSLVMAAVQLVGGVLIALVAVFSAIEALQWLLATVGTAMQWLSSHAARLAGLVVQRCVAAFKRGADAGVAALKRVFRKGLERMRLRWLYWTEGRKSFEDFDTFAQDWKEHGQFETDGERQQEQPTATSRSAYQEAIELMGLAGNEHFTLFDLKQQFRIMRGLVHPDKGFPNRIFIQQVNAAFALIKRERGF